jgi:hypothetical protein
VEEMSFPNADIGFFTNGPELMPARGQLADRWPVPAPGLQASKPLKCRSGLHFKKKRKPPKFNERFPLKISSVKDAYKLRLELRCFHHCTDIDCRR